jgi:hypothetical protein
MAAPMVAGVAALIRAANPSLLGTHMKNIIMSSVDHSTTDIAKKCVSGGLLDANKAVLEAATGYAYSSVVTFHDGSSTKTIDASYQYWDPYQNIGLYLQALYNYGMRYITFNVIVEIKEISDGYQELYLEIGNNVEIWEDYTIENPSGWQTYSNSVTLNIFTIMNYYGNNPQIRLGYGAHGKGSDDWSRRKAQVKVFVA